MTTLTLSLIGCVVGAQPDKPPIPPTGFQAEVPVRQATRIDWSFAASSAGPDAAKLSDSYDSTRQSYQLYVPMRPLTPWLTVGSPPAKE